MKFNYCLSALDIKICIIKKINSKIQTDDKVCNIQEKRQIQSFNIFEHSTLFGGNYHITIKCNHTAITLMITYIIK